MGGGRAVKHLTDILISSGDVYNDEVSSGAGRGLCEHDAVCILCII